jgi:hypothetical protein
MWSLAVRARDGRCLLCGSTSKSLDAHHGVAARGSSIGAHWYMLENGFSLCFPCHQFVHMKNGDKSILAKWFAIIDSMVSKEKQEEIIRARHGRFEYTIENLDKIRAELEVRLAEYKGKLEEMK